MCLHALGKVSARDLYRADPVLDAFRDGGLAIPVFGDEYGLEALSRGVDSRRHSRWSSANDC